MISRTCINWQHKMTIFPSHISEISVNIQTPYLSFCKTWVYFTEMYFYLFYDIILWLSGLMDENGSIDV